MIKLIDILRETKVAPRKPKLYITNKHIVEDFVEEATGYLTIGNKKFDKVWILPDLEGEDQEKMAEIRIKIKDDEEQMKTFFNKNHIQYFKEFESYITVPIEDNNIEIIDTLAETKITPKGNYKFKIGEIAKEMAGDEDDVIIMDICANWEAVEKYNKNPDYNPYTLDPYVGYYVDEENANQPWYLVKYPNSQKISWIDEYDLEKK